MKHLDAMPEVEKTSIFGTAVHAVLRTETTSLDELSRRLAAEGVQVAAISPVQPSLEDVFLEVAQRGTS
jgi:hypothetical protein